MFLASCGCVLVEKCGFRLLLSRVFVVVFEGNELEVFRFFLRVG